MWSDPGVCVPRTHPHDLSEAAGGAALVLRRLPQFPHRAGRGQPAGPDLRVALPPEHVGKCSPDELRQVALPGEM